MYQDEGGGSGGKVVERYRVVVIVVVVGLAGCSCCDKCWLVDAGGCFDEPVVDFGHHSLSVCASAI